MSRHRPRLLTAAALVLLAVAPQLSAELAATSATTPRVPPAVDLADLVNGQWIDVWGAVEQGELRARRLRLREPRSRRVLRGVAAVPEDGAAAFSLLGVDIVVGEETEWRRVTAGSVIGRGVRVDGTPLHDDRFFAARVMDRESTEPSLSGPIDRATRGEGVVFLRVLHLRVLVDSETRLEVDESLAAEEGPRVTDREDAVWRGRDEDDALGSGYELGRNLSFALQHQLSLRSRAALRSDDEDERDDADYLLRGRLTWEPTSRVSGVAEVGVEERWREREGDESSSSRVRLREAFVLVRDIAWGFDLQLGRIDFDERREWLFDQSLDGIRLARRRGALHFEVAATRTTADVATNEESNNALVYVANVDPRRHLAAYWLHRDFREVDERRSYFGVRGFGRWWGDHEPWLELAYLDGESNGRAVAGFGGDAGVTFRFGRRNRFSAITGYAWGSGGHEPEDDGESVRRARTFRQTGFADNDDSFAGVTSFRYYGELFDPELANLHIATVGFGIRLPRRSSIDVVGHVYHLDRLARRPVAADIDERLTGRSHDLGWEVDVVGGLSGWGPLRFEIVVGLFERGEAFREAPGKTASLFRLQIRYRQ